MRTLICSDIFSYCTLAVERGVRVCRKCPSSGVTSNAIYGINESFNAGCLAILRVYFKCPALSVINVDVPRACVFDLPREGCNVPEISLSSCHLAWLHWLVPLLSYVPKWYTFLLGVEACRQLGRLRDWHIRGISGWRRGRDIVSSIVLSQWEV